MDMGMPDDYDFGGGTYSDGQGSMEIARGRGDTSDADTVARSRTFLGTLCSVHCQVMFL